MSKILEQLDIVVLVLILAFGGWVAWSGFGTGSDVAEEARSALAAARGDLEARLDTDHFEETEVAQRLNDVVATGQGIAATWNREGVAPVLERDLAHHAQALADVRDGVASEVRLDAPENLLLAAEIGLIRVAWDRGARSTVDAKTFRIFRRDGSGERQSLAEVPGTETTYEDRGVVPGVLYSYDVVAVSDDAVLVANGRATSPASRGAQVRAKRDYEISVMAWADGRGRFRVRKFADGSWHEADFEAGKGEMIGDRGADARIDYRTNCRIEDVSVATETVEVTRDEVVLDEAGKVVIDPETGPRTLKKVYQRPREVVTFSIRNELGQRESLTFTP